MRPFLAHILNCFWSSKKEFSPLTLLGPPTSITALVDAFTGLVPLTLGLEGTLRVAMIKC